MPKALDLTGQKFGTLTAIEKAPSIVYPSGFRKTRWLCQCDCGRQIIVVTEKLIHRKQKGCDLQCSLGLMDHEVPTQLFNEYTIDGDTAILQVYDKIAYIDVEDIPKVNYCHWFIDSCGYLSNSKHERMHVIIMGYSDKMIVIDHIDRNKLNNCKSNLRFATRAENRANSDYFEQIDNRNK